MSWSTEVLLLFLLPAELFVFEGSLGKPNIATGHGAVEGLVPYMRSLLLS